MLGISEKTDFSRLPQRSDSYSKRREASSLSGRGVRADWFYYKLYLRKAITQREHYTLHFSPRPVRPVNFRTGSDRDVGSTVATKMIKSTAVVLMLT